MNEQKDTKETASYKQVLVVTELFNTAANNFGARKSTHCEGALIHNEIQPDIST